MPTPPNVTLSQASPPNMFNQPLLRNPGIEEHSPGPGTAAKLASTAGGPTSTITSIPLEDRLSFPEATCEPISMVLKDPDHDRLTAMNLATEQAKLREKHA